MFKKGPKVGILEYGSKCPQKAGISKGTMLLVTSQQEKRSNGLF
jgi:hypothetical protein